MVLVTDSLNLAYRGDNDTNWKLIYLLSDDVDHHFLTLQSHLEKDMQLNSCLGPKFMTIPTFFLLLQDVGQSILESYSRVMESLAFNIMARIDDVLYVDDATKQCAAAESVSLFNRGGLGGLPIQKRISPSPFSIQHTPYTSPFATPTFCSSPPVIASPSRVPSSLNKKGLKSGVPVATDLEKQWSYAGNLSARRISGDAPERN